MYFFAGTISLFCWKIMSEKKKRPLRRNKSTGTCKEILFCYPEIFADLLRNIWRSKKIFCGSWKIFEAVKNTFRLLRNVNDQVKILCGYLEIVNTLRNTLRQLRNINNEVKILSDLLEIFDALRNTLRLLRNIYHWLKIFCGYSEISFDLLEILFGQ